MGTVLSIVGETSSRACEEPGVFTWSLKTNVVHGDSTLAALFGFPEEATIAGLPIEAFIQRILPADQPRIAAAIYAAIRSGARFNEAYRVRSCGDKVVSVVAFGRCFRDRDDTPSQFSGIVIPATDDFVEAHGSGMTPGGAVITDNL